MHAGAPVYTNHLLDIVEFRRRPDAIQIEPLIIDELRNFTLMRLVTLKTMSTSDAK